MLLALSWLLRGLALHPEHVFWAYLNISVVQVDTDNQSSSRRFFKLEGDVRVCSKYGTERGSIGT